MKSSNELLKLWSFSTCLIVWLLLQGSYSAKVFVRKLPTVDLSHSGNVSTQLGKTASLRCRINNKGNFTVSWVRHRDLHLLTVDHYTYTTDQRFRALHESPTGDWVLLISSLQPRDKGLYECQIGTTPPNGHFVFLDVMEPVTKIFGGNDLHINLGSPLNLTCHVLYHAKSPDVEWFHEGEAVNYRSTRGGISVVTESGESTRSSLLISQATKFDAGNYTCVPEGGEAVSIDVHVLSGENRAAMYSGGEIRALISPNFFIVCPFVLIVRNYVDKICSTLSV